MASLTGYLALGKLSAAGAFTEMSGAGGYARQAIALDPGASGSVRNGAQILFPVATGGMWPTFDAYAVFSDASGGSLQFAWSIGPRRALAPGERHRVSVGDIELIFPLARSNHGSEVVLTKPYLWSPDGPRPAFVVLTQAAYDALAVKDPNTLYVING